MKPPPDETLRDARGDSLVVLLGLNRAVAMRTTRDGSAHRIGEATLRDDDSVLEELAAESLPEERAAAALEPDPGAANADEAARYAAAVADALSGSRPKQIVLGLPPDWLSHSLVETPHMSRIDRLAVLMRQVSKQHGIPPDDMLLADHSETKASRSSRGPDDCLVVAARYGPVSELISSLSDAGVRVQCASSGPAAAVLAEIHADRESDAALPVTALVLIRREGFALALYDAERFHLFRLVTVELPEDDSALAQVIVEEVRRSSMSYREKSRGRAVERVKILGHLAGDPESIAETVSAETGIRTSVGTPAHADADEQIEAAALAATVRRKGPRIDLATPEMTGRSSGFLPAVLCSTAVAAGLFGAWLGARHIESVAARGQVEVEESSQLLEHLEPSSEEYARLMQEARRLIAAKNEIQRVRSTRVDPVRLTRVATECLPGNMRLDRIEILNPVDGVAAMKLEGSIHASRWDFDAYLAQYEERLGEATGVSIAARADDSGDLDGDESMHAFTVELTWESADGDEDEDPQAG